MFRFTDLVGLVVTVVDKQVLKVLKKLHQEEVEDADGELKIISLYKGAREGTKGRGREEGTSIVSTNRFRRAL